MHFDEASERALHLAMKFTSEGLDLLVIRDVLGRLSIVVDDRSTTVREMTLQSWTVELKKALGAHSGSRAVVRASMMRPDAVASERARHIVPQSGGRGALRMLENSVAGSGWTVVVPPADRVVVPRVALYGFKGGVGRSRATALLAQHLARRGETVLVVDLDLESPGVSSLLVRADSLPVHGIVDYLVEQAIGTETGLDLVARSAIMQGRHDGSVWICPARGRGGQNNEYVAKLGRIYGTIGQATFASRLKTAVDAAVDAVTTESGRAPTVVLLDSRGGIHEIAAAVIAVVADRTLIFAADDAQTWLGYQDIFETWARAGHGYSMSEKLRTVAVRVPASSRSRRIHLERFVENAFGTFNILYREVPPGALRVHAMNDRHAPHWPAVIYETEELRRPCSEWHENVLVVAAFQDFLDEATEIIRALTGDYLRVAQPSGPSDVLA